jgi:hypothetical protein
MRLVREITSEEENFRLERDSSSSARYAMAIAELRRRHPETEETIRRLEKAKFVSQKTMQLRITI